MNDVLKALIDMLRIMPVPDERELERPLYDNARRIAMKNGWSGT